MVYEVKYLVGNWFVYEDGEVLCMCSNKVNADKIVEAMEAK